MWTILVSVCGHMFDLILKFFWVEIASLLIIAARELQIIVVVNLTGSSSGLCCAFCMTASIICKICIYYVCRV